MYNAQSMEIGIVYNNDKSQALFDRTWSILENLKILNLFGDYQNKTFNSDFTEAQWVQVKA